MKYINTFKNHASYEEKLNGGGVDISLPNVSYCKDVKDVHYNPYYNTVEFYVGEITPPQTVKIYTDRNTSVDVQVSEGNKWYSYLLPKYKGLYKIEGDSVKNVVVKADISFEGINSYPPVIIIPYSTVEASFKGSNTSNVNDMRYMFYVCEYLTSLDLSGWNTSNVTCMISMFKGCSNLTSLDLRNFNTSNVISMVDMFNGCGGLETLDVSSFNTNNVTNMYSMFQNCSGLTSLDLRNFNTSNVTSMDDMFNGCRSLETLDLSGWDMSKVTSMDNMFNGCSKLGTIRMKGCSEGTINKVTSVKPSSATTIVTK